MLDKPMTVKAEKMGATSMTHPGTLLQLSGRSSPMRNFWRDRRKPIRASSYSDLDAKLSFECEHLVLKGIARGQTRIPLHGPPL